MVISYLGNDYFSYCGEVGSSYKSSDKKNIFMELLYLSW